MIIAIKDTDRVVLALSNADEWTYFSDKDYVDKENLPITFAENGKVYAFAISRNIANSLIYDDDFLSMEVTPKNIVNQIVPYVIDKVGKSLQNENAENRWRNALVICDDEHIYSVDPKLSFWEDNIVCYSYTTDSIRTALDAYEDFSPTDRIILAVDYACETKKDNLYPYVITDTKTKTFKVITREDAIKLKNRLIKGV